VDLTEILKDPSKVGVVFLCLLAVAAFIREWIIPGVTYTRAISYRDDQIARLLVENKEQKEKIYVLLDITKSTQEIRRSSFEPKTT
jgi:hypothetical protein